MPSDEFLAKVFLLGPKTLDALGDGSCVDNATHRDSQGRTCAFWGRDDAHSCALAPPATPRACPAACGTCNPQASRHATLTAILIHIKAAMILVLLGVACCVCCCVRRAARRACTARRPRDGALAAARTRKARARSADAAEVRPLEGDEEDAETGTVPSRTRGGTSIGQPSQKTVRDRRQRDRRQRNHAVKFARLGDDDESSDTSSDEEEDRAMHSTGSRRPSAATPSSSAVATLAELTAKHTHEQARLAARFQIAL